MNRIKVVATIFCLSLAALVFSPSANADDWNKKTVVTFSQPVEIPGGAVLPAGTYVFKLLDSLSDQIPRKALTDERAVKIATACKNSPSLKPGKHGLAVFPDCSARLFPISRILAVTAPSE